MRANLAERRCWQNMKDRCRNPNNTSYRHYGGRGIKVCARWLATFENFLADMGPRPSSDHSIDRIDNDGDYAPENCRWATDHQQARNTRASLKLTHNGETKTIAEWAEQLGVPPTTIYSRHDRGWSLDGIVTAQRKPRINEINAARTECKFGHPFTPETTLWIPKKGRLFRRCKICRDAYQKAYHAKRAAEARA